MKRRRSTTIYEVAHHAGVSIATVSRVHRSAHLVSSATRARVDRAVAELGYRPSRLGRSLARGHHDTTGIVFPDLSGPFRPDAIVCANDEIAMGVLEAARAARITIPQDLAITGWDDIPAARHLAPPLTTVRQPMLDLGRRAAELLRERISTHRREPLHEHLPTEMVIRSSCGCT